MIYSQPGAEFTALLEGAAPGGAGQLGITIIDGDANTVVARTVAGISEVAPATGIYVKNDLVAPEDQGVYLVVWDDPRPDPDESYAEELRVTATTPVIVGPDGYPPRDALVAASSVTELTSLSDDEQDTLRAIAISDVEEFTGQHFDPRPGTRLLDSDGMKELYLEERLAQLDSMVVARSALDATGVVLSDRRDRLHLKAELGQLNYAARALMDLSGDSYAFTPGFGTVQITGIWGWLPDEFPWAVFVALLAQMEDLARANSSQVASRIADYQRQGVRSASQGDVSFAFRDNGYGPVIVSDRVKSRLLSYVWPGAAGRRV